MAVRGTSFSVTVTKDTEGRYIITENIFHGKVEAILLDEAGAPTSKTAIVNADRSITICTSPNEKTGNPAEIDGTSVFVVYDTDTGEMKIVPEGEDPTRDIDYELISAIVREYALRSNDTNLMEQDENIVKHLKGIGKNSASPANTETAATTASAQTMPPETTVPESMEVEDVEDSKSADAEVTTAHEEEVYTDMAVYTQYLPVSYTTSGGQTGTIKLNENDSLLDAVNALNSKLSITDTGNDLDDPYVWVTCNQDWKSVTSGADVKVDASFTADEYAINKAKTITHSVFVNSKNQIYYTVGSNSGSFYLYDNDSLSDVGQSDYLNTLLSGTEYKGFLDNNNNLFNENAKVDFTINSITAYKNLVKIFFNDGTTMYRNESFSCIPFSPSSGYVWAYKDSSGNWVKAPDSFTISEDTEFYEIEEYLVTT